MSEENLAPSAEKDAPYEAPLEALREGRAQHGLPPRPDPDSAESDAAASYTYEQVREALRAFLPDWNYPPHVVAAICLQLKAQLAASDFTEYGSDATDWASATLRAGAEAWGMGTP